MRLAALAAKRVPMLVFLGDFKPDYLDPTLPFEADDYPIVNLDCAISDSDDERASKAYSIIVKLQVLDALSNYSLTMVSVASTERTGANLDRNRCRCN